MSADRAWKYTTGDPGVDVAILDTGIRWESESVRTKIYLNANELPRAAGLLPATTATATAFDVDDYDSDSRVDEAAGEDVADAHPRRQRPDRHLLRRRRRRRQRLRGRHLGLGLLRRRQQLLRRLQLLVGRGPRHRPGRGGRRAWQRRRGRHRRLPALPGRAHARVGHVRGGHQQLRPGGGYAADNGIEVVEGAVGALFNSRFARETFEYAYRRGVFFAIVSSDLNTADHNIPTVYDEAMQVQGTVADHQGLGSTCRAARRTSPTATRGVDRSRLSSARWASAPPRRSRPGFATRGPPSTEVTPTS